MPLIFMLILTIIIPTVIYIGKNIIQQPTETAEIEKQEDTNEEKISAASVTVKAGRSYTIPKDGIYKIELHGGKSADIKLTNGTIISGNKGSKVTGYVDLLKGDILSASLEKAVEENRIEGKSLAGANGITLIGSKGVLGYVSRWTWFKYECSVLERREYV